MTYRSGCWASERKREREREYSGKRKNSIAVWARQKDTRWFYSAATTPFNAYVIDPGTMMHFGSRSSYDYQCVQTCWLFYWRSRRGGIMHPYKLFIFPYIHWHTTISFSFSRLLSPWTLPRFSLTLCLLVSSLVMRSGISVSIVSCVF